VNLAYEAAMIAAVRQAQAREVDNYRRDPRPFGVSTDDEVDVTRQADLPRHQLCASGRRAPAG